MNKCVLCSPSWITEEEINILTIKESMKRLKFPSLFEFTHIPQVIIDPHKKGKGRIITEDAFYKIVTRSGVGVVSTLISGKQGTGKSELCVYVAQRLKQEGKKFVYLARDVNFFKVLETDVAKLYKEILNEPLAPEAKSLIKIVNDDSNYNMFCVGCTNLFLSDIASKLGDSKTKKSLEELTEDVLEYVKDNLRKWINNPEHRPNARFFDPAFNKFENYSWFQIIHMVLKKEGLTNSPENTISFLNDVFISVLNRNTKLPTLADALEKLGRAVSKDERIYVIFEDFKEQSYEYRKRLLDMIQTSDPNLRLTFLIAGVEDNVSFLRQGTAKDRIYEVKLQEDYDEPPLFFKTEEAFVDYVKRYVAYLKFKFKLFEGSIDYPKPLFSESDLCEKCKMFPSKWRYLHPLTPTFIKNLYKMIPEKNRFPRIVLDILNSIFYNYYIDSKKIIPSETLRDSSLVSIRNPFHKESKEIFFRLAYGEPPKFEVPEELFKAFGFDIEKRSHNEIPNVNVSLSPADNDNNVDKKTRDILQKIPMWRKNPASASETDARIKEFLFKLLSILTDNFTIVYRAKNYKVLKRIVFRPIDATHSIEIYSDYQPEKNITRDNFYKFIFSSKWFYDSELEELIRIYSRNGLDPALTQVALRRIGDLLNYVIQNWRDRINAFLKSIAITIEPRFLYPDVTLKKMVAPLLILKLALHDPFVTNPQDIYNFDKLTRKVDLSIYPDNKVREAWNLFLKYENSLELLFKYLFTYDGSILNFSAIADSLSVDLFKQKTFWKAILEAFNEDDMLKLLNAARININNDQNIKTVLHSLINIIYLLIQKGSFVKKSSLIDFENAMLFIGTIDKSEFSNLQEKVERILDYDTEINLPQKLYSALKDLLISLKKLGKDQFSDMYDKLYSFLDKNRYLKIFKIPQVVFLTRYSKSITAYKEAYYTVMNYLELDEDVVEYPPFIELLDQLIDNLSNQVLTKQFTQISSTLSKVKKLKSIISVFAINNETGEIDKKLENVLDMLKMENIKASSGDTHKENENTVRTILRELSNIQSKYIELLSRYKLTKINQIKQMINLYNALSLVDDNVKGLKRLLTAIEKEFDDRIFTNHDITWATKIKKETDAMKNMSLPLKHFTKEEIEQLISPDQGLRLYELTEEQLKELSRLEKIKTKLWLVMKE